jgi:hypothetical protein
MKSDPMGPELRPEKERLILVDQGLLVVEQRSRRGEKFEGERR